MTDLIKRIKLMSEKPLLDIGISIYHLEYVKEGNESFLRYYIDKIDGIVDIDVCVEVSRVLSDLLDKEDPIPSEYTLEVASSGAEKPLVSEEHFQNAINQYVHFYLNSQINGTNEIEGTLLKINEDSYEVGIKVKTVNKRIMVKKSEVASARLAIMF